MIKKGNKQKSESMKKPDIYFKIFRRSDPSTVIMSNSAYLDHVINLLLFPNYETVEQAIVMIKHLPVLKHQKSAIFICAFLDSSSETSSRAFDEFKQSMGFTVDDHHHVYFWLHFMKMYFKQVSSEEEIMFLKKFESFEEFNITIISRYLTQVSEMSSEHTYKIPLIINISLMLMNFIAKLQQHYYDIEREKEDQEQIEKTKTESMTEPKSVSVDDLIDFGDNSTKVEESQSEYMQEEQKHEVTPPEEMKSTTEKYEFHHELITSLLKTLYKLVVEFSKNDRVKEYLVKTSFLQKAFIFMSNRIERFPILFNILTDPDNKVKELISHLFLSGLKFRGHKIISEFIENLCIVLEEDRCTNMSINSPCNFFFNLMVTDLLFALYENKKLATSDISQCFFAIIMKMYQLDLHKVISTDTELRSL